MKPRIRKKFYIGTLLNKQIRNMNIVAINVFVQQNKALVATSTMPLIWFESYELAENGISEINEKLQLFT